MGTDYWSTTPALLASTLKSDFPEVIKATRINERSGMISKDQQKFNEVLTFVDSDFLDIFTIPMISGNEPTPISQPFTMMLTQEMAKKYFGDKDPIGKTLLYNNTYEFKINGVLKSDSITISGGSGVGFMRNKKDKKHVCPKPLNLMEKVVKRLSNERDMILDPFIGSGTTMEACQNLQRQCIGIDVDPYYCELVKERCFHKTFLDRKAEYSFEVYDS